MAATKFLSFQEFSDGSQRGHMKMRATLKLNNSGAARNAVAEKSISSSQRPNRLTLVSLPDGPDHKNGPVACSLEGGAIAISMNLKLF